MTTSSEREHDWRYWQVEIVARPWQRLGVSRPVYKPGFPQSQTLNTYTKFSRIASFLRRFLALPCSTKPFSCSVFGDVRSAQGSAQLRPLHTDTRQCDRSRTRRRGSSSAAATTTDASSSRAETGRRQSQPRSQESRGEGFRKVRQGSRRREGRCRREKAASAALPDLQAVHYS